MFKPTPTLIASWKANNNLEKLREYGIIPPAIKRVRNNANPQGKYASITFRPTPYVKEKLSVVPKGKQSMIINKALQSYFEINKGAIS